MVQYSGIIYLYRTSLTSSLIAQGQRNLAWILFRDSTFLMPHRETWLWYICWCHCSLFPLTGKLHVSSSFGALRMSNLTYFFKWRLTLAGLIALLKIPESHAILLLNVYCIILGLSSIASTRAIYNLKEFDAHSQGYATTTAITPKTSYPRIRFVRPTSTTMDSGRIGVDRWLVNTTLTV